MHITDNRYGNPEYLTQSGLANFVSYDIYGTPSYNYYKYLYPGRADGKSVMIGRVVDRHFTEGVDFRKSCGKEMTLDEYKMVYGVPEGSSKWKKADWDAFHSKFYDIVLSGEEYEACETVISTIEGAIYAPGKKFVELFGECDTQVVLEDDELQIKGKLDFLHKDFVMDLKVTSNIDNLLSELMYRGNLNIYHRYWRQLSWYSYLSKRDIGKLLIVDHKGAVNLLTIKKETMDKIWQGILRDIQVFRKVSEDPSLWSQVISASILF